MELERLLTFNDLRRLGIVNNRVTLGNYIRKGGFPVGRLIGPNRRVWTETEIREYIASRPTGPKSTPIRPENLRYYAEAEA